MTLLCPTCRQPVTLPAGWQAPGYTCPHCHQPAPLPRQLPAVVYRPPPPFEPPEEPRRVVIDHRPQGSFGTGFGGAFGCLTGVTVFFGLVFVIMFSLCGGLASR